MTTHWPEFDLMHGNGNRFAIVEGGAVDPARYPELARQLARSSARADGLLVVDWQPGRADVAIYNADGSTAPLCGNGLRCLTLLGRRQGWSPLDRLRLVVGPLQLSGRVVRDDGDRAVVAMRMPPATITDCQNGLIRVDLGNAHAVMVVDELPDELTMLDRVESMRSPGQADLNWHAVRIDAPDSIAMVSLERGVGPTAACASGATAAVAGLAAGGLTSSVVEVHQPGGPLRVHWRGFGRQLVNIGPVAIVSSMAVDTIWAQVG